MSPGLSAAGAPAPVRQPHLAGCGGRRRGPGRSFSSSSLRIRLHALEPCCQDGRGGRLSWPAYAATDLAPFGACRARVNYPVVVLHDRAVRFCGVAAYDNWSRVQTVKDLGLSEDPNRRGASGMEGRQRGNRTRRLLYAWTDRVGQKPFRNWLEIGNSGRSPVCPAFG